MKVSLDWIKDYVALPQDLDLKKLAYDLTMSTVEVEDVEDLAERFNRIVVGQIAAIEAHPNAEKLRICKTDIGGEIKDIVCGGINLREGMKVAVSLPGAMVRWHGEGEPVEIKETKLRGVPSFGMICASSEIGLGDLFPAKEEAEIVDLSFLDCPAGTPIADALDLHDILLEIDTQGALNVMKKFPQGIYIFILPPSLEELEKRLRGRGTDTEEVVARRMAAAAGEIAVAKEYAYTVVNDKVENTVRTISAIVTAEHARTAANLYKIEALLRKEA